MTKRFFDRNTFSEETPVFESKQFKNLTIDESRSIMQMIIEIKLQLEIEARQLNRMQNEGSQMKSENSLNLNIHSSRKLGSMRSLRSKGMNPFENAISNYFNEDDTTNYPNLLEALIEKFTIAAQNVKNNLKKLNGLSLDEQFVLVNIHVCEYCGKEFAKPCALGGHISKLHSQARRRDFKMKGKVKQMVEEQN